jgi:hypothetical protein
VRAAATVILCIGLSFGVLGAAASIGLFFFGDTVLKVVINAVPGTVPQEERILSTPLHTISVFARLPVVLLGGIVGLLGNVPTAGKARARACGALTFAAGIVLLLYQGWICAGAYVIGGFLVFFPLVLAPPTGTRPRK